MAFHLHLLCCLLETFLLQPPGTKQLLKVGIFIALIAIY